MKIAKTRGIPIILHSRKAEQRVFEMLCEERVQKALFHCFCGKMKLAKSIASAGYVVKSYLIFIYFWCILTSSLTWYLSIITYAPKIKSYLIKLI